MAAAAAADIAAAGYMTPRQAVSQGDKPQHSTAMPTPRRPRHSAPCGSRPGAITAEHDG